MKNWYKSKTIWFNIVGLIIAAAGELSAAFPSGQVAKISGYVLTLGNIFLRLITTQQIGVDKNA
jgi:hypothetical protein